ncbi:hypothetical protein V499_06085 [Pseudogymnoascus sp. VKM F-103]|uniref:THUMP domain-containing protein n=1 Tax=Pseudogymnoascus verrucosus TaxID=342668 RepID=A0A1B8GCA6_9PEZI|nr:uncharacterized protein VE01_08668 [Pseudogymnoascus verrucosus]KFY73854.1 hypothetical protein V499_06085 [Pseudogymnoascus sp. VKM F-103]OBT93461.1 hypothetical protein VE01_08668 [Pseudogymnoascus verrucosus]
MADTNKRKSGPGDSRDDKQGKRSKGGSGGKWQTPHQKSKASTPRGGGKIEPGDAGIWATCMKSKEGKATEELKSLFEHSAEKFYNISPVKEDEDEDEDIEASIRKEISDMAATKDAPKLFQPVFLDVQCVLFFKLQPAIEPVDFVHRICEEAASNPTGRKHRFLNRLTPMTRMGRATQADLEGLAREVLQKHFRLVDGDGTEGKAGESDAQDFCSYAIRPTIRNHSLLKRDVVINTIANLIDKSHKVSLTNPDKVILVELYQNVCGISVVGSDWETLKRYNLNEIYLPTPKPGPAAPVTEGVPAAALSAPDLATKDETHVADENTVAEPMAAAP